MFICNGLTNGLLIKSGLSTVISHLHDGIDRRLVVESLQDGGFIEDGIKGVGKADDEGRQDEEDVGEGLEDVEEHEREDAEVGEDLELDDDGHPGEEHRQRRQQPLDDTHRILFPIYWQGRERRRQLNNDDGKVHKNT